MINRFLRLFMFLAGIILIVSCEYEFIEPYTPPPVNPTDTVFFQAEITPIFVNSGCTNCHNGGIAFDFTTANAYNSIISNDLVVPFEPENSLIYTLPNPQTGTHGTKYSSTDEAGLIYSWIEQGALNN
jgi:hypothetical protein